MPTSNFSSTSLCVSLHARSVFVRLTGRDARQFNQTVRVRSIALQAANTAQAPRTIKLLTNRPSLGFEDVEDGGEDDGDGGWERARVEDEPRRWSEGG